MDKLAAYTVRTFLKAADARCNAMQEAHRTSGWAVDGAGTRKQRAQEKLEAADAAYEAARNEVECLLARSS